jgi:NAD(P)-dependent dehydrogenase (short-subunit alcohol dehydrogenase family)
MGESLLPPDDRVIMVSGASRGIGAATARRLLNDGYRLSLGVRDRNAGWSAIGEVDRARVTVSHFDALDPETASAWVEATMTTFGKIDGLVNNAGVLRHVGFDADDDAALDEMWAVNVKAPFRLIRATLPHLRASGCGRIVNIGSTDGKRYRDPSVSVGYAMTKHALVALSHATRFAGWGDGVRVTALLPGAVDTDLIAGVPGVTPGPGRIDPDVIARAVAYLLSLPNNAAMAEFIVNSRLESTL